MTTWTDRATLVAVAATAIGTALTAVGVFLAGWQLRVSRKQSRTQFEDDLTKQYRAIVQRTPVKALIGEELNLGDADDELHCFFDYFDLTNEQLFLRKDGRISKNTWKVWSGGIQFTIGLKAFSAAWEMIGIKHPKRFEFLYHFLKTGSDKDPKEWPKDWQDQPKLPAGEPTQLEGGTGKT